MKLTNVSSGEEALVEAISLPDATKRRLIILGLTDFTKIKVLRKKKNGASVVKVRGVRYALGKQITDGIFVTMEEVDGNNN